MGTPNDREQEKKQNRIIVYWRTYNEENITSTIENDSTPEEMFEALCSEIDSAKHFHPDERRSLEAMGRFVDKYRSQIRFDTKK